MTTGRRQATVFAIAAAILLAAAPTAAQDNGRAAGLPAELADLIADSYIFVFAEDAGPQDPQAMVAAAGGTMRHVYSNAIRGFAARMPAAAAARLAAANPQIAYYHEDIPVFAIGDVSARVGPPPGKGPGSGGGGGGGGGCEAEVTPPGVTVSGGPVEGTGRVLWVIDTGVDYQHPDLVVDTADSVSIVGGKDADDKNGHGTHVAGTAAALDNECQVVGVAQGATVVAVKVLKNSGSGSLADVVSGVDYVAANALPGDVANMSLGGTAGETLTALDDAVIGAAGKDILFAISAGNETADTASKTPARAEHDNIFTVAAVDTAVVVDGAYKFAGFSNFGAAVDVAAPGVGILSLMADGETLVLNGTSMAAPHVAGVLLIEADRLLEDRTAALCSDVNATPAPNGDVYPVARICP